MDKEKEIERLAEILYGFGENKQPNNADYHRADYLINSGYGNVEQAVREFAEKFCDLLWIKCGIYKAHSQRLAQEVMKVLYGN